MAKVASETSAHFYVSTHDTSLGEDTQLEEQEGCVMCMEAEQHLTALALAWKEDVKEKTLLKQKVASVELQLKAYVSEIESLTRELVNTKMAHAQRDEEALKQQAMQAATAKMRARIAEAGELEAAGKVSKLHQRVAELSTALGAAKRNITALNKDKAQMSGDLEEANAIITRLTTSHIPCSPALAASAEPHLTYYNEAFTPSPLQGHNDEEEEAFQARASWPRTRPMRGMARSDSPFTGQQLSPLLHASTTSPVWRTAASPGRKHGPGASEGLDESARGASGSPRLRAFHPTATRTPSASIVLDPAAIALLTSEEDEPAVCMTYDDHKQALAANIAPTAPNCNSDANGNSDANVAHAINPCIVPSTSMSSRPSLGGSSMGRSCSIGGGSMGGSCSFGGSSMGRSCSIGGSSMGGCSSDSCPACKVVVVKQAGEGRCCTKGQLLPLTKEDSECGAQRGISAVAGTQHWWTWALPRCVQPTS